MVDKKMVDDIVKTTKTAQGLRDMLFEEIDKLRDGKSTPKRAQTIARLADSILASIKVELNMFKPQISDAFARLPDTPELELKNRLG